MGCLVTSLIADIFAKKRGINFGPFFAVILFFLIIIIVSRLIPSRHFINVLILLAIGVSLVWSIGFDYSHSVKVDYHNIAYYETTKGGDVLDTTKRSVWGGTIYSQNGEIINPRESHIVCSYTAGDIFYPVEKEYNPLEDTAYKNYDYIKEPYYAIKCEDGRVGYIFSGKSNGCDINIYYYENGDFVTKMQANMRTMRWYGRLPEPFLNFCGSFFEKVPIYWKMNLV